MIERVHFTKPLLKQLNAEGYSCVDMHYHTQYSDTYTRIGNILKKCKKRGLGAAITDHNEIRGCVEAEKRNNGFDVLIMPGMEASCQEGQHLLVYFYSVGELKEYYNKVTKKNLTKSPHISKLKFGDLLEKTEKYSCVISAAHPFNVFPWNLQKKFEKGRYDLSLLKKINAFEVISGLNTRRMNLKAVEWAREHDKAITAGSDGHTLGKLGSIVSCSKADDVDSFLKSILKKRNFVCGNETKRGYRVLSNVKAISRQSRYAGRSLKIHYDLRLKGKVKPKIKEKLDNVKKKFI